MKKHTKHYVILCTLLLIIGISLAACQAQPEAADEAPAAEQAPAEDTSPEEADTEAVEEEATEEEEMAEEEAAEPVEEEEAASTDIEAIGSEEDDGGSPFVPNNGPKTSPTRVASAAWEDGLVLTWLRVGGIAGFCERVLIYATGEAVVTTCDQDTPEEIGRVTLTAEQRMAVDEWVNTFAPFDDIQADPEDVADGMTVELRFAGEGDIEPTAEEKLAMQTLASEIIVDARTEADG